MSDAGKIWAGFLIISLFVTIVVLSVFLVERESQVGTLQQLLTNLPETKRPVINSFSGEVEPNSIYNLLLYNTPNCSLLWNSAASGTCGNLPSWVAFDFLDTVTMTTFQFANYGDITHDVIESTLSYTNSLMEPWTSIATLVSESNTPFIQSFTVPNITARYFRWDITNTASGYQAYIKCVNFTIK